MLCSCDPQGVWLPRALHRRVQHESAGQAKASGKVLERPRHQAPLRPTEGLLCLLLGNVPPCPPHPNPRHSKGLAPPSSNVNPAVTPPFGLRSCRSASSHFSSLQRCYIRTTLTNQNKQTRKKKKQCLNFFKCLLREKNELPSRSCHIILFFIVFYFSSCTFCLFVCLSWC